MHGPKMETTIKSATIVVEGEDVSSYCMTSDGERLMSCCKDRSKSCLAAHHLLVGLCCLLEWKDFIHRSHTRKNAK